MAFSREIGRCAGFDAKGKAETRYAVRAIITKGDRILMINVRKNGEYKFPGGGLNPGEDRMAALAREVREESGAIVRSVGDKFGEVVEYSLERKQGYDYFRMTSEYYRVEIEEGLSEQELDPWEKDLLFAPEWVEIAVAHGVNRKLIEENGERVTKWIQRETMVLEELMKSAFRLSGTPS